MGAAAALIEPLAALTLKCCPAGRALRGVDTGVPAGRHDPPLGFRSTDGRRLCLVGRQLLLFLGQHACTQKPAISSERRCSVENQCAQETYRKSWSIL
jgi:hypothetical protein